MGDSCSLFCFALRPRWACSVHLFLSWGSGFVHQVPSCIQFWLILQRQSLHSTSPLLLATPRRILEGSFKSMLPHGVSRCSVQLSAWSKLNSAAGPCSPSFCSVSAFC